MNILKSGIVLVVLSVLVVVAACSVRKWIAAHRDNTLTVKQVVKTVSCCLVAILCIVLFGTYTYPFERPLEPILIAEIDVPEVFPYDDFGAGYWCGVYEEYGLYAGSFYFNPDNPPGIDRGVEWPKLDVENYSYIVTYCQKIDTITYNVWDTIDIPIRTGAKVGRIVFDKKITPSKVYVYQIPKMRIDNADGK